MKTQYFLMMNKPKENLFYLKGDENGAFYTISPENSREGCKGFMSLGKVKQSMKPWHKGILKVSDTGISLIERV